MGSLQGFAPAITHWCFGIAILVGLVSSSFSAAETILGVLVAGCACTLSAICSYTDHHQRPATNLAQFLIIWLEILSNLVAAATCARMASATVDYISKGHFRELLFGLEQHSLGEPWPDVLGVTIILVVTVLFMMGLERSSIVGVLLLGALLSNFAFFTVIGSFHTVNSFQKWVDSLTVHSFQAVLRAASFCSFAFVHKLPITSKNNCLKIATILFMPLLFYVVLAIVFSFMTRYRELEGTAIPLIQVFQNRDVDWARPVIAVFTICSVCLLLTEILPCIYFAFVHLASREWKVFVSPIQYQSRMTGAPVLAIFAAGSLVAILAFACPLAHLLKLLNVTSLLKCVLTSCYLMYNRYRPDLLNSSLMEGSTVSSNVQYSKLAAKAVPPRHQVSFKEKLRRLFGRRPQYIHKLSSPKAQKLAANRTLTVTEEQECLIFKDPNCHQAGDGSNSENEENEMEVMSGSDGESSTDIDVIVEEYKEGMRVSAMGSFSDSAPSTPLTSFVLMLFVAVIVLDAASIPISMFTIQRYYWVQILVLVLCIVAITTSLPENASEKSKPSLLPSALFPLCHSLSITANILLASMLISTVWQGIMFWTLAGLLLYWKCDCCQCSILEPLVERATAKVDPQHVLYKYQDGLVDSIVIAS